MRAQLSTRLERLERRSERIAVNLCTTLRLGSLKKLPRDYVGERHVVVAKHLPPQSPLGEWVEFEERPGPEPEQKRDATAGRVIDICFVSPEEPR